jgi:D-alanyl-D-alanine carboxypeptidase (penicillin-binding protein 5/6)
VPPSPRVRRRRRAFVASTILVALAIAAAFYVPITLSAPVTPVTATATAYTTPTTPATPISMPTYGSSGISAVGYPGLLAKGGTDQPLAIGSITKIITALIVLQKKPLALGQAGPDITFTEQDVAIRAAYLARDGEVYPVTVGAQISESDVLTTALVASANNYARALVDWAFGSEANYVPIAKAWLKSHGLTSTTLTDCTGMDPTDRSTPTDLIALGKLALANPVIAKIVDTKQTTMPVVGAITNTNLLLGTSGVHGIKTGTLNTAGASLLFESDFLVGTTRIQLIGAVIDGPDHPTIDAKITSIIKAVIAGFVNVPLVQAGQKFGTYTTEWGTTSELVAARSASVVLWSGTPIQSAVSLRRVSVAAKGTQEGTVDFTARGTTQSVPLVLSKALVDPGKWWRLTHPGRLS